MLTKLCALKDIKKKKTEHLFCDTIRNCTSHDLYSKVKTQTSLIPSLFYPF